MDIATESYLNSLGGVLDCLPEDIKRQIISEIQAAHIQRSDEQNTPVVLRPSD